MHDKQALIRILPQGRKIPASLGENLLEALMHQSIFLRADCGGKGTCGKCLVHSSLADGTFTAIKACQHSVNEDISIEIPEASMLTSHIMSKAPVSFPAMFQKGLPKGTDDVYGVAVDLGTTTLAVYLCNTAKGEIVASLAVKNPQAIYGDDIMSRIGAIDRNDNNLGKLQKLVIKSIEWGMQELLHSCDHPPLTISRMVVVGNPTMIHILAGINPQPIGISPYRPVFYDAMTFSTAQLGFIMQDIALQTLPQVSGFIGGDLLAASLAVDLEGQPEGTLLVDLGTNGELILKNNKRYYATSCATGPAFEGASISCGMQAIPGAINSVTIGKDRELNQFSMINPAADPGLQPSGICGAGIINTVAQLCRKQIILPSGAFASGAGGFVLVAENQQLGQQQIAISQKDIRSVQLGKSALITGIEFLLMKAGCKRPEKIIIAGAFGSHLQKDDLIDLGIIPNISREKIEMVGNAAGAGAVMALCDTRYIDKATKIAAETEIVDLAGNAHFQDRFIDNLALCRY